MARCRQCGSKISAGLEFCPTCGSKIRIEEKAFQPEKGTEAREAVVKWWVVRVGAIFVLIGGVTLFLNQLLRTYHPVIERQPEVAMVTMYGSDRIPSTAAKAHMVDGFIDVSLREVREHRLVRFFDPEGIQEVPMIAYITPQGKLVTAMSKSEHCGSTDFFLSGNDIHCASCPSYWNMASLEAYACCQKFYPDPFPSTVVGDEIRISPEVVRNWKSRL